jgi:hypothetical protein
MDVRAVRTVNAKNNVLMLTSIATGKVGVTQLVVGRYTISIEINHALNTIEKKA